MNRLTNKRILLGITGGIAAYKSADLTRRLQDEGADVRVVMTSSAQEFITPLTMQALSGHPVHLDLLDTETESVMGHIELARWADVILVAPATADFIARYATGRGDDLLTTLCLAADCTLAVAPAMNQAMWGKETTQQNISRLRRMNVHILEPDAGLLACGETGAGRLMEVPDIVAHVCNLFSPGSLAGRHVVITAGPTREAIDPVRYISNHSSGKQGYALAEAAVEAGARVTLVSGPTGLQAPEHATLIEVESARDMLSAVLDHAPGADVFIGVAAVADYRPEAAASRKLKKQSSEGLTLALVQNPDIIKTVAELDEGRPFTVGFAAETENLVQYATRKLATKNLDMVVANHVSKDSVGFNSDDNQVLIVTRAGQQPLPKASKAVVARKIISLISEQLAARQVAAGQTAAGEPVA